MTGLIARLKIGLASFFGAQLDHKNRNVKDILGVGSVSSGQPVSVYTEKFPHIFDVVREIHPSIKHINQYVQSIFPFVRWLPCYNLSWFMGDLIAGITIGVVVVPQGMAYAILAGLPPQYGLYTSFMGVLIYWIFATSKDITIGPVAVLSVFVGKVVSDAKISNPDLPSTIVASTLAVTSGIFIFCIGILRCGWIIVLIPLISISAFATGSAITITLGQIPTLLGIRGIDSSASASAYYLFVETLKHIPKIKLDAAIGLPTLFLLYFIRIGCNIATKKYPSKSKLLFFMSTLRTVIVILLFTMISWLINRNHRKNPLFRVISTIPRGFTAAKVPVLDKSIISNFLNRIPAATIIMLIEHIAIAKSFGRINFYVINPSQEMLAIGMTNILGSFLGAFSATGSFSRTAIKAKAGVRTPLAGVITSIIILLAIYALPTVFFYVPSSTLSAVIIHSVLDLITPPRTVYEYWRISPLEVPIFIAGVIVTIFRSVEDGIYTTVGASFLLFICRFIKSKGRFLGTIRSYLVTSDSIISDGDKNTLISTNNLCDEFNESGSGKLMRDIFLPLDNSDGTNPGVKIIPPKAGIFVFRFSESFNYLNANYYLDQLTNHILANTRRTNTDFYARPGDRPWNDPKPIKKDVENFSDKPTLKAIILDFSAVNYVDVTSIQQLIDVRNQLDRYASPSTVDWYFCNINNRWTKRALVAAQFGYPKTRDSTKPKWKGIVSLAKPNSPETDIPNLWGNDQKFKYSNSNLAPDGTEELEKETNQHLATVNGLNYPLFHPDLMSAWQNAIINLDSNEL